MNEWKTEKAPALADLVFSYLVHRRKPQGSRPSASLWQRSEHTPEGLGAGGPLPLTVLFSPLLAGASYLGVWGSIVLGSWLSCALSPTAALDANGWAQGALKRSSQDRSRVQLWYFPCEMSNRHTSTDVTRQWYLKDGIWEKGLIWKYNYRKSVAYKYLKLWTWMISLL